MEWLTEYWYLIILGLVAVMFLFGYRSKGLQESKVHGQHGAHHDEKPHKGGHGCCH